MDFPCLPPALSPFTQVQPPPLHSRKASESNFSFSLSLPGLSDLWIKYSSRDSLLKLSVHHSGQDLMEVEVNQKTIHSMTIWAHLLIRARISGKPPRLDSFFANQSSSVAPSSSERASENNVDSHWHAPPTFSVTFQALRLRWSFPAPGRKWAAGSST